MKVSPDPQINSLQDSKEQPTGKGFEAQTIWRKVKTIGNYITAEQ